ncbi:MAG: hypothetical protein HYS27_16710 [Deltaproteobacteria bacterium]|nr:hypothetical protein [Deltaproteobacteria bacterium]
MLVSALLLVAGATGEPPAPVWRLDLPVALVAQAPASGVDTRVVPWLGVRVARMLDAPNDQLLVFGGDAAAMLGFGPNEGTSKVRASRFGATLEGRGLAALNAFHTATVWVRPYGYGALQAGGAISTLSAYADQSLRLLPVWGLGAGAGLELTVHVVALRVELGAGVRDGAFALDSRLAVGAAF